MNLKRRRSLFIAGILLSQVGFIAYGLWLVFWVLNEWLAERALNAIFGAGLGGLMFFMAWWRGREWVRGVWRKNFEGIT